MYKIDLTKDERSIIEEFLAEGSLTERKQLMARIILLTDVGLPRNKICEQLNVHINTVTGDIKKFAQKRTDSLTEPETRKGAPVKLTKKKKEWIYEETKLLKNKNTVKRESFNRPKVILQNNLTLKDITQFIRSRCVAAGFPELQSISETSVYKALRSFEGEQFPLKERSRADNSSSKGSRKQRPRLYFFWDDPELDFQDIQDLVDKWQSDSI